MNYVVNVGGKRRKLLNTRSLIEQKPIGKYPDIQNNTINKALNSSP